MADTLIKRDEGMDQHRGKTMWRHMEKMAIYKPLRKASEEINPADTLFLDFLVSKIVRKLICCLSHSVSDILL